MYNRQKKATELKAAELSEEMQRIIDRAQELIDATADEVDDKVRSARSALMRGLDSARNESGRLYGRAMDKAAEADEYIRDQPYYAIAGVFAAGLFMGWLMSRK